MIALGETSLNPPGGPLRATSGFEHVTRQERSGGRRDNVRQRILDEATRLFAENGYEGTTLQAVADAVGVRKPSLLYHYRSKEALHEAVIGALLGHWKEEIPRLLLAATDERDRLAAIVKALLRFFQEDVHRARLVIREVLDHPDRVSAAVREHLLPWMRLITDYIRMDQVRGRVRQEVDPEAFASHVVLMVVSMLVAQDVLADLVGVGAAFPPRMSDELVRITRDALFTDASRTRGPPGGHEGPGGEASGARRRA